MIDNLVGVSESGLKATQLNAYINVKTAEKIQFGPGKCHTMKIPHKNAITVKNDFHIDYRSEKHDEKTI